MKRTLENRIPFFNQQIDILHTTIYKSRFFFYIIKSIIPSKYSNIYIINKLYINQSASISNTRIGHFLFSQEYNKIFYIIKWHLSYLHSESD
jgi:hypothetical protein